MRICVYVQCQANQAPEARASAKDVKILFKMPRENTEVPNTDASISVLRARESPHCHTTRNSNSNLSLV